MNCARCGACCTSFGVCITPSDIVRISLATSMRPSQFVDTVQDYPNREREEPALFIDKEKQILVLKRSKENVCFFYSDEGCKIYHYRPLLCRTYPFGEGMKSMCSRACPSEWAPEGSEREQYGHDIFLYEKELAEFQKFAKEWNSKGGGSLSKLLKALLSP
ncbi:YkgJ family cysteine cluster protein [Candidatus Micrarchaeota archaeon]|nr:YkgJ family cysteine cluster protein [Candidatus Micrarchaeota archaeon]